MALEGLDGKVAWITGGATGIGRATALALSARGVRVLVTGRDEKALGRVVGEIVHGGGKGRHLVADVRDPASAHAAVAKALESFGALDIVVASAGVSERAELGGERARSEAILATNLMGAFYTFDAAAPAMKGPGRLVAIGSAVAEVGAPGYTAYCASKAGLLGLVRATARELAARHITCNAIVPGRTDTGLIEPDVHSARGRLLEPEEIAERIVALCARSGDAITGEAIAIEAAATSLGA